MPRPKTFSKAEILTAIQRLMARRGVPPTVEELRAALKVGSNRTVLRYLKWLEDDGDIQRWPGGRGIRLRRAPGEGLETRAVPLVGEAPAGPLMLAEETHEGWLRLPVELAKPRSANFFLLRVRGDSMNRAQVEGERIEDGDLVLVRQQTTARPDEIVVALIDGEATIKRLARGPNYYFLKPESTNRQHQPILAGHDFQVLGVVTRVIKNGSDLLTFNDGP
jgi:repressor LexA